MINRLNGKYTTVLNSVVNNPKLSAKAKGIYIYLQSKPDGWQFYEGEVVKNFTDGIRSIRGGIKELIDNNLLLKYQEVKSNSKGFKPATWILNPTDDDYELYNITKCVDTKCDNIKCDNTKSVVTKSVVTKKHTNNTNNNNTDNNKTNNINICEKFDFTLKRKTSYDNLSDEYKDKLYAACMLIDGSEDRFETFITSCRTHDYKYKNFTLAYMSWDKEKNYKNFKPDAEPSLGENWFKIKLSDNKVLAVNDITYEVKHGQVKD